MYHHPPAILARVCAALLLASGILLPAASVEGRVFDDADNDGAADPGESGLHGVLVELFQDANGNGAIDDGEDVVATATTDASGNYLLDNLPTDQVTGDGTFLAPLPPLTPAGAFINRHHLADFTNDGAADVVMFNANTGGSNVSLQINRGTPPSPRIRP